jgi:hypothetical protein
MNALTKTVSGLDLHTVQQVLKWIVYLLLVLCVYWGSLGHRLYTWDNFIWVAGFAAIEMNVSEWRDEILSQDGGLPATPADRIGD